MDQKTWWLVGGAGAAVAGLVAAGLYYFCGEDEPKPRRKKKPAGKKPASKKPASKPAPAPAPRRRRPATAAAAAATSTP